MAAISANGGMSMTNGYDVQFDLSSNTVLTNTLKQIGVDVNSGADTGKPGSLINMFCDEAQLPALQFATGQVNGIHLGRGATSYAHTRLVTDFSLTWMCDANMIPYKFLVSWYNLIQGTVLYTDSAQRLKNFKPNSIPPIDRDVMRIAYPKDYKVKLRIAKTERGANAPNSRVPLVHFLTGVYPYMIDAVPLSYGTSQVTRVSASFYYDQIITTASDIRKYKG